MNKLLRLLLRGGSVGMVGAMGMALAALALPAAWATETVEVTIEGMKFEPQHLTLQPGDTVVWRNKDLVPHTASTATAATAGAAGAPSGSTSTDKFDTGLMAAGASKSWTATQAGRYDYICTLHPGMRASLTVQ